MAACLAKGESQLVNAAREPEITDLAKCLVAMGAKIDGIGSDTLTVQGVDRLHAATHSIVPDRIETGTYAVAAAITGGDIELVDTEMGLMEALGEVLESGGISVMATERGIRVSCPNGRVKGIDVMTEPFPGFPDRPPGAVHGADDGRRRGIDDYRDDFRKPIYACPGADPHGREHQRARCVGDGAWRRTA